MASSTSTRITRDLVAIEHLVHGPLHHRCVFPVYRIELRPGEFAALTGFSTHGGVDLAVDGCLHYDQVRLPEPLSIEIVTFGIDVALMQNARGFCLHAHVKAGTHGLALPYLRHRHRM